MPTKKWQSSSGASKNRILGATRLKSEGQTIFPVILNDNSSNGFALNVQGSNLVLGLGTSEPFSRLSMGNNTDSGLFNANDTGRLASLAFNETSSGGKFSGIFYNSSIAKYDQTSDISSNGIQFKTTSLNNFDIYGSGGNLFITDENITTVGGFPRKGITELDNTDYKGIEKYIKPGNILGSDDPDNETLSAKEGQSKIVLDVRGSIRTDGYINFFNTKTTTIIDEDGETRQKVDTSPSAAWWSNADRNIPMGSVWLQPTGSGRSEGMYFKNTAGKTLRIETIATTATDSETNITKGDALAYDVFNFFFSPDDITTTQTGVGNSNTIVAYPYVILKGGGKGDRVQGESGSRVGGTALNIRGKNTLLTDIKHTKGFFNGENPREIFSITQGNMSVTGLSGEEFLIKQKDPTQSSTKHPMYSFADHHGLFTTDASGGKVWIERQLLIGPKKSDLNWGLIDIQSTPNVPTLLSYNLDKDWDYSTTQKRLNKRYITEKATNAIILLNKSSNTTGDGTTGSGEGGSLVGSLYDCSNSIIIGDTFTSIDTPKSLIITVNPTLTTGDIDVDGVDGQQVFDDIGGSIVSGYNNWVYKSPYSLVIGENNFIDNNQPGSYNATGLNSVLGDYNELRTGTTNFVAGSYHKVSGGGSNFVGGAVNHIGHVFPTTKERNANKLPSGSNGSQYYYWNTALGYYNKIRNDTSGVNYSFAAGNANLVAISRGVALGTHAYAGGDIRFAIGTNDNITTTTASSGTNSNRFVIDKDGNVGIGTSSPSAPLSICGSGLDGLNKANLVGVHLGAYDGTYGMMEMVSSNSDGPWIDFKVATTSSIDFDGRIRYGESSSMDGFKFYTNHSYRMCITKLGNVGIGTTSPTSALHIDASIGQGYAGSGNPIIRGIHLGMNSTEANINLCAQGDSYSRIQFSKTSNNYQRGSIQYYHGSDNMQFFVNNNKEALRLMSNGDVFAPNKVGIGTTSPWKRFHIQTANGCGIGFGDFTNSATSPGIYLSGSNSHMGNLVQAHIWSNDPDYHDNLSFMCKGSHIWYNVANVNHSGSASARMTLLANGNLGIGTTSPGEKLEIKQGNVKITQHNSGFGDEIYGLMLKNGVHNRTLYVAGETYGGDGTHERHLYLGYTEDSTITNSSYTNGAIVTVRADGNVGIGTTSPSYILDVNSSNAIKIPKGTSAQRPGTVTDGLIRYNSTNNEFEGYGNSAWGSLGGVITPSKQTKILADDTNGLEFYTGTSSANERMTILANGNVGIGTSSPSWKLDMKVASSGYDGISISDTQKIIEMGRDNTEGTGYIRIEKDGSNSVLLRGDGNSYFNGGNVGIGTDSPGAKLSVSGGVGINTGSYDISTLLDIGSGAVSGTRGNKSWTDTSWRIADYHMWFRQSSTANSTTHNNIRIGFGNGQQNNSVTNPNFGPGAYIGYNAGPEQKDPYFNGVAASGDLCFGCGPKTNIQSHLLERMRICSDGTVGIGTSSPGAPLHISYTGGAYNGVQGFINEATSGRSTTRLRSSANQPAELFFDVNGAMRWDFSCRQDSTGTDNDYNMYIYNSPNATSLTALGSGAFPVMVLTQNGRVGIGNVTVPECALDVNGSLKLRVATSGSGEGGGIFFRAGTAYSDSASAGSKYNGSIIAYAHDSYKDGLSINGYDGVSICTGSNTRNERMRVAQNGSVGINTTAPLSHAKLHVNGNVFIGINPGATNGTVGGCLEFASRDSGSYDSSHYSSAVIGTRTHHDTGGTAGGIDKMEMLFYIGNNADSYGPDRFQFIGAEFRINTHTGNNAPSNGKYGFDALDQMGQNWEDAVPKFIVKSDGRVGLNVASPTANLQIKSYNSTNNRMLRMQTGRSSNSYLEWTTSGTPGNDWQLTYSPNGSSEERIYFWWDNQHYWYTGNTQRMKITSAGRLLVGTNSNVTYGYSATFGPISGIGGGDYAGISIMRNTSDYVYMRHNNAGGDFSIQCIYGGSNGGTIKIQPYGGNVYLGDTSPKSTNFLYGETRVQSSRSSNYNYGFHIWDIVPMVTNVYKVWLHTSGKVVIQDGTSNGVSIGSSSNPGCPLHVWGYTYYGNGVYLRTYIIASYINKLRWSIFRLEWKFYLRCRSYFRHIVFFPDMVILEHL